MNRLLLLWLCLAAAATPAAQAVTYLTQPQALELAFKDPAAVRKLPLVFDAARRGAIEKRLDARVRQRGVLACAGELKDGGQGVAFFDGVIGKHEYIDYMLVLDDAGKIRFVEILEYRESYGGEIRKPHWRGQFRGLSEKDPPRHEGNIVNISGATLSCRHVTEGVRKLLAVAAVYAEELGIRVEK